MRHVTPLLAIATLLIGCQSQAERDRKKKADYAAYTAGSCQHAKDKIAMVQNTRAIMNNSKRKTGLEGFAKTVCAIADKAAKDTGQQPYDVTPPA